MIELFIHYLALVFCVVAATFGVSRGHAKAAQASLGALERQPAMQPDIFRSMILSLALIETAAILGLLTSLFIFFAEIPTLPQSLAELGMAFAVGIPALVIGWFSAEPAAKSIAALARQPFLARRLSNFSLLVLALIQTPLLFGFIIAQIIRAQTSYVETIGQGLTLLGAGLAAGFGCVGPVIGRCNSLQDLLGAVGRNRGAFPKLFTFMFVSQAIIETPILFALIISLLLTRVATTPFEHPMLGIAYLIFGALIGIGTLGPGISSGQAAAATAVQIGYTPEAYTTLSRASMVAQGLIDTIAIYAFMVALLLILTPLV